MDGKIRRAVANKTTDDIIEGKEYKIVSIDEDGLFMYIIDESGEETAYHYTALNEL